MKTNLYELKHIVIQDKASSNNDFYVNLWPIFYLTAIFERQSIISTTREDFFISIYLTDITITNVPYQNLFTIE